MLSTSRTQTKNIDFQSIELPIFPKNTIEQVIEYIRSKPLGRALIGNYISSNYKDSRNKMNTDIIR